MKSNNLTGGAGNLICVTLATFTHNEVPLQLQLDRVGMVNRNTLSSGGKTFWNELAECKGWRLQKNMITQHCRILDPEGIRRAWGGDDVMERLFQKLNK